MDKTSSNTVPMAVPMPRHEAITVPADDSEYPKFVEYMKKIGLGKHFEDGDRKAELRDRMMMMYFASSEGKPHPLHMKKLYRDFRDGDMIIRIEQGLYFKEEEEDYNMSIKIEDALKYALDIP